MKAQKPLFSAKKMPPPAISKQSFSIQLSEVPKLPDANDQKLIVESPKRIELIGNFFQVKFLDKLEELQKPQTNVSAAR